MFILDNIHTNLSSQSTGSRNQGFGVFGTKLRIYTLNYLTVIVISQILKMNLGAKKIHAIW